jgi:hypothetical protein
MAESSDGTFKEWCILELFGHRRMAGLMTEQQIGGVSFLRLDIPKKCPVGFGNPAEMTTQFYSPQAVYSITPTTQEIARELAVAFQPEPVSRWEFPKLAEGSQEE